MTSYLFGRIFFKTAISFTGRDDDDQGKTNEILFFTYDSCSDHSCHTFDAETHSNYD